jgi:histidinol-phosphate aminotransferase
MLWASNLEAARRFPRMRVTPDQIIRDEIRSAGAYHVPDSRGYVKLDAMENPYGLPPDLAAEVGRLAAEASLNRYPDPSAAGLKARLREVMGVPADMDLLVGNGSDEIILMLALAVNRPGATLLAPEPSFVLFRMAASFVGLRYAGVPLAPDFGLDLAGMESAIRTHRPAVIFLAYPNNPTGNLFDPAAIDRIVELAPGLVVVDEAYHAFAGETFLTRLERHPNLLVMRTLSKLGLAGLRLGLLVGRAEWLRELDKVRLPYNVNVLTQVVAQQVLGHVDVLNAQAASIRDERGKLYSRLSTMPGAQAFPSRANFILFRVPHADAVFAALKARGVLIKNLNGSHPMLAECLRVTVGLPDENDRFVDALQGSLEQAA